MSENQKRILQMLAEGKISVDEATRLLYLIGEETGDRHNETSTAKEARPSPKYLYIRVEPKEHHGPFPNTGHHAEHGRVNVRVPVGLIRAGIKLKALIPPHVADEVNRAMKEKGVGFDIRDLKDEYLEGLITALGETEINVDSDEAEVRIHAE